MAEGKAAPGAQAFSGDRRFLYIGAVLIVFVFIFVMAAVRTCGIRTAVSRYTVIYSNLELKDAANVISKLKEMRIPYEIRDEGKSIAVLRDRADQARLGLAESGLPAGGVVGWEIFDETKLGATDFDRRIQFIRAISGELARTIRQIEAVRNARVQIVIPETRIFEVAKAPVTASVLLTLNPGKTLTAPQVNGIIHLVASAVENLQPENVTLVDVHGNIMAGKGITEPVVSIAPKVPSVAEEKEIAKEMAPEAPRPKEFALLEKKEKELKDLEAELKKKQKELEARLSQVELERISKPGPLSPEERALLRQKLKKELEDDLAANAQKLLNRFYPPNTVIVRVNIETGPPKVEYVPEELTIQSMTKKELTLTAKEVISIHRITAVVLVDNRIELSDMTKKDTYQTVAGAIGYSRARGDTITLRRVPFHLAMTMPGELKPEKPAPRIRAPIDLGGVIDTLKGFFTRDGFLTSFKAALRRIGRETLLRTAGFGVLFIFIFFVLRKVFFGKRRAKERISEDIEEHPSRDEVESIREGLRTMASTDPGRIAGILEKWLAEETG